MNEYITAISRHILTTIGGVMVAKGIIDQGSAEIVIGGLSGIIGVIWSIFDKKKRKIS